MRRGDALRFDSTVPAAEFNGALFREDPRRARALVRGAWLTPILVAAVLVAASAGRTFVYEAGLLRPSSGPIALLTNPREPSACLLMRVGGRLVVVETSGLGIQNPDGGPRQAVMWPLGSTARFEDGRAVLVSPGGNVIAREGDLVAFDGAGGPDGYVFVCDDLHRVDPDLWS